MRRGEITGLRVPLLALLRVNARRPTAVSPRVSAGISDVVGDTHIAVDGGVRAR